MYSYTEVDRDVYCIVITEGDEDVYLYWDIYVEMYSYNWEG